jgi:hypothetical protein
MARRQRQLRRDIIRLSDKRVPSVRFEVSRGSFVLRTSDFKPQTSHFKPESPANIPAGKAGRKQKIPLALGRIVQPRRSRRPQRGLRPQPKNCSHKATKITKKSATEMVSCLRGFVASCENQVFVLPGSTSGRNLRRKTRFERVVVGRRTRRSSKRNHFLIFPRGNKGIHGGPHDQPYYGDDTPLRLLTPHTVYSPTAVGDSLCPRKSSRSRRSPNPENSLAASFARR